MAFFEGQLRTRVSLGAASGTGFSTDIIVTQGEYEFRNRNNTYPIRSFTVNFSALSSTDKNTVRDFIIARDGNYQGFRVKDWSDYSITAQVCGTISALTTLGYYTVSGTTLQLFKMYSTGEAAPNDYKYREIKKPVSGTLTLQANTGGGYATLVLNTDYTLDTTTGIVTFTGYTPTGTDYIKIQALQFDVPARFDIDDETFNTIVNVPDSVYGIEGIALKEIRV